MRSNTNSFFVLVVLPFLAMFIGMVIILKTNLFWDKTSYYGHLQNSIWPVFFVLIISVIRIYIDYNLVQDNLKISNRK